MEQDYKWIAQDECGVIWKYHTYEPTAEDSGVWINGFYFLDPADGKQNPNWRDTLIDLEKEDYEIVDGILTRKPRMKEKPELTDTDLLDAIVGHELMIDVRLGVIEVGSQETDYVASNKKGNIRKAIKKWLRKNT